jgi:long-chain acyl-CoA synthetase
MLELRPRPARASIPPVRSMKEARTAPLHVGASLQGKRLLVVGGTGFLGKVWLSMLVHHYPDIGHVWLLVRSKKNLSSDERFWSEIATSVPFAPLRRKHGADFEAFLRSKVTPIDGDVSRPLGGLSDEVRAQLRGNLDALVNASGVVDFNPPLDEAIKTNAFGPQQLVGLAKDLGDLPFFHTSTCYVAGDRTGQVDEVDPRELPFPKAAKSAEARVGLEVSHWDPDREIAECVDLVESARHRAEDAFRQSQFHAEAKANLERHGEPTRGAAFADELQKVRRKYIEKELSRAGEERAQYWGWHNTYTYTKAIGEQIIARSGLRFTIVRPAIIESAVSFPEPGWNEGINTSAPLIYLAIKGAGRFPTREESVLDFIPVDMVASGMIIALAELLDGTAPAVYQLGSSDSNPVSVARLYELVALYKRKTLRTEKKGNPIARWVQQQYGPHAVSQRSYERFGQRFVGDSIGKVTGLLRQTSEQLHELAPILDPTVQALEKLKKANHDIAYVMDIFLPFICTHSYRFSTRNMRAAWARLEKSDRMLLDWSPEKIDWRDYFFDVHIPGLEKHVFPLIEERVRRPRKALRRHDTLVLFLEDLADRHEHATALSRTEPDGFSRTSYAELRARARATAARIRAAGVEPGDRVLLAGENHPDWPIAYFGILYAGAVCVPVDRELSSDQAQNVATASGAEVAILDAAATARFGAALDARVLSLAHVAAPGPHEGFAAHAADGDTLASILYTSGTTGMPKGVMLTHQNFTALVASLGQIFDLGPDDRVLSVLPLHHTFEFTCGLLLPLSRGARIVYLDELTGDRLAYALKEGRITAMVGVPALWQLLERRITSQVKERGPVFERAFDAALAFNRSLGKQTGFDAGRLLFGTVHARLGGNLKYLISGGAALPSETHSLFQGLGLHLAEGYGLTEAAPVLTVAEARPGAKAGQVGRAIPGVELRIENPDPQGVGEVLARGPNVMKGYYGDRAATEAVLDSEGWLHTGDLGRLDPKGRLVIVGRAKEVVVTASGENIYLDDVEERIGRVAAVKEYVLVGLDDPRGGERLGMLAVPEPRDNGVDAPTRARAEIKKAIASLHPHFRPTVIHLVEADLPRTATRKVKRKEARAVLERIVAASVHEEGDHAHGPVRSAVARVAGRKASEVTARTKLVEELGFDSLMWVELGSVLEGLDGPRPPQEALMACETVGEVEALVRAPAAIDADPDEEKKSIDIPPALRGPLKKGLRLGQRFGYEQLLDVQVTGRALIPQNRPVICVCNHTSHLDMGLVKHALGPYGENMVALAAQDYFFEGSPLWVTYFEELTNLRPIDRSGNFRTSLEQAKEVVATGAVVLLFPEGTRRTDGQLGPFRPLVGKLALESGVDVLPLYLDGPRSILPKGAFLPRGRKIKVRIGLPIEGSELVRLTSGLRPSEQARVATQIIRQAVSELEAGRILDTRTLQGDALPVEDETPPLERAFVSLPSRAKPEEITDRKSWYFSLGETDELKWTVSAADGAVQVTRGKPAGGKADCVVKTSPDMMLKIIEQAYTPEVNEFVTGVIKTSDLDLLVKFSQSFRLGPQVGDEEEGEGATL